MQRQAASSLLGGLLACLSKRTPRAILSAVRASTHVHACACMCAHVHLHTSRHAVLVHQQPGMVATKHPSEVVPSASGCCKGPRTSKRHTPPSTLYDTNLAPMRRHIMRSDFSHFTSCGPSRTDAPVSRST